MSNGFRDDNLLKNKKYKAKGPLIIERLISHYQLNIEPDFNFTMFNDVANALKAIGLPKEVALSNEEYCRYMYTKIKTEPPQPTKSKRKLKKIAKRKKAKEFAKSHPINITKQPTQKSVTNYINSTGIDTTSDKFLSSFEWKVIRKQALNKYKSMCMCCGASPSTGAVLNVDHIKPRKFFPELALDINNLQVLCGDCNAGKGNWDTTDHR
jgi:5-methylcytosine-specific restriction endonuclease McrA